MDAKQDFGNVLNNGPIANRTIQIMIDDKIPTIFQERKREPLRITTQNEEIYLLNVQLFLLEFLHQFPQQQHIVTMQHKLENH